MNNAPIGIFDSGMGGLTVLTLPGHKSKNHKRFHNLG